MFATQFNYDMAEPDDDSALDEAMYAEGLDPEDPLDRATFLADAEERNSEADIDAWESRYDY